MVLSVLTEIGARSCNKSIMTNTRLVHYYFGKLLSCLKQLFICSLFLQEIVPVPGNVGSPSKKPNNNWAMSLLSRMKIIVLFLQNIVNTKQIFIFIL